MDITISSAILHVLDTNITMPVLSDNCLAIENYNICDYLKNHIQKCIDDDASKKCIFREHSQFLKVLDGLSDQFVAKTQYIATEYFKIMLRNPLIPHADLVCILWNDQTNDTYFSVLKMNYRDGYIHHYQKVNSQQALSIIPQQTLLPSPASRIEEAFTVNCSTHEILLSEKKYEIDGVKDFYLSTYILDCQSNVSEREKFTALKKAVIKISKEIPNDKGNMEREITSKINKQIINNNEVDINELCQEIYYQYPQIAQSLEDTLKDKSIKNTDTIKVSKATIKRLEKQSVKTSDGIEIKIPVALYQDGDAIEFINNPDGTISLLVKNVLL